jgi:biopolymer transport protein ExbD
VAIVFFSLATATVGEQMPVAPGVTLPDSRVGETALQELTVGISNQVTLNQVAIMTTPEAAAAQSNNPSEPLLIPKLYNALRVQADSLRKIQGVDQNTSVKNPLAIHGDKTMPYSILARVMQTARLAGFRNVSLQVNRTENAPAAATGRPANQ